MRPHINHKRLYPLLMLGASVAALAGAYIAQYVFDLEPCILCLYQRIPFALAIALALVALFRPDFAKAIMAMLIAVFIFEGGLAFYHVGVEQHWWAAATGCSSTGEISKSPAEMLKNIQKSIPKPCDEVDWTILGISMATWNVLFSSFLAGLAFFGLRQIKTGK
ncbi:MAG: disulfide bond formation protein B [Rhodospirillaceae bacterium]|nr:disulfide bond formation protein B [Rhodospirillaceae bacterium]